MLALPGVLAERTAGLLAMDLQRDPIDIDGYRPGTATLIAGPDPLLNQVEQPLIEHGLILWLGKNVEQPGDRRLRGECSVHDPPASAIAAAGGEDRIAAQGVGIPLVVPALADHQQGVAKQLAEHVLDPIRIPGVRQALGQPGDDPGPLECLALKVDPGIRTQSLRAGLDLDRAVERRFGER